MSEENNNGSVEYTAPEAEIAPYVAPELPEEVPAPVYEAPVAPVELPAALAEGEAIIPAENVITAPSFASSEVPAMGIVENGVIGATVFKPEPKKSAAKKSAAKKAETVAIYSTKNVTWNGVGKVYRGYNIVEKDAADKWLTRDHCRIATPEEVAKEFGK
jgi:hypothetical protein